MALLTRYRLRRATLDDLSAIVSWPQTPTELRYLFPRASWPAEPLQLLEHLAGHEDGFVVCDEDRVLGFASLYNTKHNGRAWIGHLVVHPRARRMGVARYLVCALSTIAQDRHQAIEMATICFANNQSAYDFYHNIGFRNEGWETRIDHKGDALKVYRLTKTI
ncbi:GNAT family N-acetyltransferase [Chitinibacter bivalviorum]|uniref:GNAT family N-acetyltransferase n=1 Tax=Chitinibacter bivalviorum TaxID=2739434 RepID=A0A7H9BML0_9NEIS|nr:GNAT family N-acetyltransferase [Chitinibacter bivalviorum]QLG89468.1 GNAT family N-acetyltransferase [Chitinibacter bivalviorum]